jgi:WD40 repeat protein
VGNENWVSGVVLNNGGKFIVSESEDKKMRIWDKRNKR